VKTGDAELELWVEAKDGRAFCLVVLSRRRGRPGSKAWARPQYRWWVEEWASEEQADSLGEPDGPTRRSPVRVESTFQEAMRRARRHAEKMEARR
jgi:hypothetical protein